ncbi:hypothetical protein CHR55_30510 [Rhodococcus qingshengii]|uniref:Uncharacterized protein n=1 Tax=Rhodococcus qingshengii TaxID=334542 RepID=A0A2A5J1I1_RHOSG|nr:hypothetical protein CHR55_30510 [Rhodococcus qingshengii]
MLARHSCSELFPAIRSPPGELLFTPYVHGVDPCVAGTTVSALPLTAAPARRRAGEHTAASAPPLSA